MHLTRRAALAEIAIALTPTSHAFAADSSFAPVADQTVDEAIIYVFRPSAMTGAIGSFHFGLDDSDHEYALGNGRYIVLRVAAGPHTLRQIPGHGMFATTMVDLHLPPVTINTEAGQHYFVMFSMNSNITSFVPLPNGGAPSHVNSSTSFLQLAEEQALSLIAPTRLTH